MVFGLFAKSKKDNTFLVSIIIAVVFFYVVLPKLEKQHTLEERETMENIQANVNGIDTNKCSRDCCSHTQWQPPHMPPHDSNSQYIGTNLSCNRGEGSGCLCMTQGDFNNLQARGGNK